MIHLKYLDYSNHINQSGAIRRTINHVNERVKKIKKKNYLKKKQTNCVREK